MLIKWKTSIYHQARIERVECTRETDKAVWVLEYPWVFPGEQQTKPPVERRRMKSSDSENFHDTWEDAHAYLTRQSERQLDVLRAQLAKAQGTLGNIKGMKNPD
jgi:hypothetical protein